MSVHERIHDKLVTRFSPAALEVINESRMHAVPKDSETHFKVVVVSDAFAELALVQRHRRVHETLRDELAGGVHALSVHAYTLHEWTERGQTIPASPPCLGGSKAAAH